ncbi:MAG: aldo/keto reductase [Planctomycetota bacterium]
METMQLGRTGLTISRTGFGRLPIQRIGFDDAKRLLRKAVDGGVTFFDTARGYTDSEAKLGYALAEVRDRVVLATTDRRCKAREKSL